MARSELPDNWQDLAAGYVLNNLDEAEIASWEKLLKTHPELSNELEELQSAFNLFADVVPMHQPSDQLLSEIRATAQADLNPIEASDRGSQSGVDGQWGDRSKTWLRIGGAIAASVVALLGVQLYFLNSQLQQANATIEQLERDLQYAQAQAQTVSPVVNTLQQPGTLIYSLQGSNLATSASGRLVMSAQQEVIILVQNLPQLPEGKVYRLWADLPTEAALTYCGQFNSNTQGIIQLTPSSNLCGNNPTQMVITVDAATDPTTRGGPVVMQGQI